MGTVSTPNKETNTAETSESQDCRELKLGLGAHRRMLTHHHRERPHGLDLQDKSLAHRLSDDGNIARNHVKSRIQRQNEQSDCPSRNDGKKWIWEPKTTGRRGRHWVEKHKKVVFGSD